MCWWINSYIREEVLELHFSFCQYASVSNLHLRTRWVGSGTDNAKIWEGEKTFFPFLNHYCFSSGNLVYRIILSGLPPAKCLSLHLLCLTYLCMCTGQTELWKVSFRMPVRNLFAVAAVRFSVKSEMLLEIVSNCGDLDIWRSSEIFIACIVAGTININLKSHLIKKKVKKIPAYTVTMSSDRYSVAGLRYYFESLSQQL